VSPFHVAYVHPLLHSCMSRGSTACTCPRYVRNESMHRDKRDRECDVLLMLRADAPSPGIESIWTGRLCAGGGAGGGGALPGRVVRGRCDPSASPWEEDPELQGPELLPPYPWRARGVSRWLRVSVGA